MKIRRAEIRDSALLAQIQVDSYQTSYAGTLPPSYLERFSYREQEQDWRDLLSSGSDDVLYVADTRWWLGGLRSLHVVADADPAVPQGRIILADDAIRAGRLRPNHPARVELIV